MKIKFECFGNILFYASAGKIFVCCFLVWGMLGCARQFKLRSGPEMARRPYTLKEEVWLKVIGENYPKWNQPYLTVEPNSDGINEENNNGPTLASSSNLPIQRASHRVGYPAEDKIFNREIRIADPLDGLPPKHNRRGDDDLPAAIFDRAGTSIPPALNQPFKIVPEHPFSDDNRALENPGLKRYRVLKGESLMVIARKLYGDESAWKRIYNLNRDALDDPDNIRPGMTLLVP